MIPVPGVPHDVSFGGVDEPLPDWRKETPDTDDPMMADEPDSNRDELASVLGMDVLGDATEASESLDPSAVYRAAADILREGYP